MAIEAIKGASASYMNTEVKTNTVPKVETAPQQIEITPVQVKEVSKSGKEAGKGSQGEDKQQSAYKEKALKTAVETANQSLRNGRTRCAFAYNEPTNRISIKVYDVETEEVIREIPSEEALEMIEKIWEIAGIMVDEKR